MAYVRKKGNQLAIVHGERDPATGEVVQNTLFTFFSKAEAYRAIGRGGKDQSLYFQHLMQDEYPSIKFDWKAINKGINDHLDVLPDLAPYREQRLVVNFKESLCAFTRELVQSDPQGQVSSARLLSEHKLQLEFLREVIDMKLLLIIPEENQFNGDNEFFWRQSMKGRGISADVEEMASNLYRDGDYEAAAAAFGLLVESFPNYAEGFNYLGLIALDSGKIELAIEYFRKTVEIGRKLFPKRIRRELYWNDLKTRPYIRGLRNLALALVHHESFDEALSVCGILDSECNDRITADCHRAAIYLNTRQWSLAEEVAIRMRSVSPMEAAIVAFSQYEQGKDLEAITNFLFAAFNNPLGIEVLVSGKCRKPKSFIAAEDYNGGIEMRTTIAPYLASRTSNRKAFFLDLLRHSEVKRLHEEVLVCTENHMKFKDPSKHSSNFKRWHEIKGFKFAEKVAKEIVVQRNQ